MKNSKLCKACAKGKNNKKPKINWPNKETLQILLDKFPTTIIANSFKVSGKAIEKHCKKLGLSTKPRGYWQKPENDQHRGINICDYVDITTIKK